MINTIHRPLLGKDISNLRHNVALKDNVLDDSEHPDQSELKTNPETNETDETATPESPNLLMI